VLPLDVFAGQDLVVLARYDGSGQVPLRVEGRSATGTVTWSTTAQFPLRDAGNRFVPRLWAAQRLGWLAAEKRKRGGNAELDAEIRSLGERYGIPTEFSSYLVLEPGMQVADLRRDASALRPNAASPVPLTAGSRLSDVAVTGAAGAAKTSSQEERFERARQAAAQREVKSVAELDSTSQVAQGGAYRQIGARQFTQQQALWVDQRYTQAQRLVKVKAFSPLYFELVSKLSGLNEVLVLGDQVLVSGRTVAIQVGPDGAERMSEREVADLVKAW